MPKMKTHKGAAKRFKQTGSGKIKRRQANKSHIMEKTSPKRTRQLRRSALVSKADTPTVRKQLGI